MLFAGTYSGPAQFGPDSLAGAGAFIARAVEVLPSLSVSADRSTISRQRPEYVHFDSHLRQKSTVARNWSSASAPPGQQVKVSRGSSRLRTNVAFWPSSRVNTDRTPLAAGAKPPLPRL